MDEGSKQLIDDCFLRPIVDSRSINAPIEPPPSKTPLKTELQVLRLSDEGQNAVMETLRYIHGQDFQFADKSKYMDKGSRLKNGYWQERGNLVIQGGCDFSDVKKSGCDYTDRYRMFAILKLESYGFHKPHCFEALEHCKGNVDDALDLLYAQYFPAYSKPLDNSALDVYSESEILEMRQDEMSSLQSIYDTMFEEQQPNRVWQLKLKIDHLLVHSPSEQRKRKNASHEQHKQVANNGKPLALCRNFAKGKCKYGVRCRFSHKTTDTTINGIGGVETKPLDPDLDANWFYLEIRFAAKSRYPFEAPMMFLKTTCPDIPPMLCLRITRRIAEESQQMSKDGMASVYTVSDLLQQDDEIATFLRNDRYEFLNPKNSIFHVYTDADTNLSSDDNSKSRSTHYAKGTTGRSDVTKVSLDQRRKDDLNLVQKFMDKQKQTNYKAMLKTRQSLPAWSMMTEILETIGRSKVVVISGETGCGKSTQVPQFILDEWMLRAAMSTDKSSIGHIEIVCTQPRRISAIGVAERVADERSEKIGNTVGYQIRLENKISTATRLTFCTTGILLRRLQSDDQLDSISHVLVDEVHERSEESDFLLLILKELLVKRSDLKVILMSATLNAKLFSDYFNGCPVLEIPGRTFSVEQIFLEDILDRSKFVLEADSQYCRKLNKNEEHQLLNELEYADVMAANSAPPRSIRDENLPMADLFARYNECSRPTCKTLFLMDPMKINPELIETILKFIVDGGGDNDDWPRDGSILIFLPGLAEIQTIYDALTDSAEFSPRAGKYILVPLHSTLTNEEQSLVFQKPSKGRRKIVLSTNIAETSVTIDDCVFVIDCGQMKEKRFDANRNMESLDLVWVSRANALQRKGRAGRVMPGVCIHLFTKHRFSHHFLGQPVPEIHRVPLEQLLLRIKTLPNFKSRSVFNVISNTIEPPSDENIQSAIKRLQDVGAFDLSENLTALGHHLAQLPVDVRIGKLMLFGAIFQCVDSVLTIAACLSYKSPFVSPFRKRNEADAKKKKFAICNSDHLTVLMAYKKWLEASKRSKYAGKCYCDENFLSWRTLETLVEIKQQFLELLISIGFVPVNLPARRSRLRDDVLQVTGLDMNSNSDNNRLLSALLCAALYPNVVKVLTPEKSFTMSAAGALPRQPLPHELRFKTNQDGYVFIHPSSINSICGHFTSPFLVFQEKVKTSKVYIRECTMVPLLPLVLFSGSRITIELHSGEFVILLQDGWIMMQAASHQVAEMVKHLRTELVALLEQKIRDPCLNLLNNDNGRKIISTIVQLITKE